ncbi:MAG: IPT/TIG domain-containing protein, partial [Candidatus Pacebacteria bacterium]|nr:IPT/TIG domain-containing protein [Candidatus Paceibacterota bacterium]
FNVKRPGDKSVSLTQPVGNVVWEAGAANLVKWSTDGTVLTDKVDIVLISPTNAYSSLALATANDGSESVTLSSGLTPGTYTLFLRLTGTSINSQYAYVTIVAEGEEDTPFISSISPATGATSTEVTVKGSGFTSSNTLKFGTYTIGTNLASSDNGTEINFVVPATITTTGGMPIVVSNANGTSNPVTFALVNSWSVGNDDDDDEDPVETKIEVTSPDTGSKSWILGTTQNITWTSSPQTGAAAKVNIRLINQDTNQISDINLGATNNGTYTWTVGNLANGSKAAVGKYKFRVCPVGLGDCDRSDYAFKIVSSTTTTDPNAKTTFSGTSGLAATASVLQSLINQLNNLLQSR